MNDLPNLDKALLAPPAQDCLEPRQHATHPSRILLLYGSLRDRSYSRLLTYEAARLLDYLGAETRIFDPSGLPFCRTQCPPIIRKYRNCAISLCGRKGRSGAARNATAR